MRFDTNRFAKLAGLPQTRRTLNESRRRALLRKRRMISEARGYTDDPTFDAPEMTSLDAMDNMDDFEEDGIEMHGLDSFGSHDTAEEGLTPYDYVDIRHGVTLPHEEDYFDYEDDIERRAPSYYHEDDRDMMRGTRGSQSSIYGDAYGFDDFDLYEGEEKAEEKAEEGKKGKKAKKDDDDLIEIDDRDLMNEVRNIKRKRINEARLKAVIEDELREVLAEMQYGSSWMYGDNKPQTSRKGQVTRGFKGLGFK